MSPADRGRGAILARYGSIAIQMGVVIALFSWLGDYLDKRQENQTPWWTMGLSLFGIFAALYLALRDFLFRKKESDQKNH